MKRVAKKYLIPHKGNKYRPYLLRSLGIASILFFIFGSLFFSKIFVALLKQANMVATVLPAVLIDLANTDRAGAELPTLAYNPKLAYAASLKAKDMAERGYFSHNSPEGITPWYWFREAGYDFVYAGENLAVNFDDSQLINESWMNSPLHRANILNGNYTEVGIATAEGMYKGEKTTFVVQLFGSPAEPRLASGVDSIPTEVIVEPVNSAPLHSSPPSQVVLTSPKEERVLGDAVEETFVAVKDETAVPLSSSTTSIDESKVMGESVAPFSSDYASSPTRVLGIIYFVIAFVLGLAFIAVLFVKHDDRKKHIAFIVVLFVVIFGAYFMYKYLLISRIEIK